MSDSATHPISRRDALVRMLALSALVPLAGCTGTEAGEGQASEGSDALAAQKAVSLTFGLVTPAGIDPCRLVDASGEQVAHQLFDPLTRFDCETGILTCLAAERYEASEDQTTFTFTLRDATFHDGTPVRASDFKRAWERLASPNAEGSTAAGPVANRSYLLSLIEGYEALCAGDAWDLSGVTCPDDRTLVVKLVEPYADFPFVAAALCLAPVPAAADDDPEGFARLPIGNGPFMLESPYEQGDEEISLVRYDGYALAAPSLERVTFLVFDRFSEVFRAFEAGDVAVSSCPIENVDANAADWKSSDDERLELNRGRHTVLATSPVVSYLVCNTAAEPFDSPAFRRALSMAIDRDGLVKSVFRDARMPADGIVAPMVPGYRPEAWPYAVYDAQAASDLLDAACPRGTDGERGVEISLVFGSGGGHENAMEAIARDLEAVGVTCALEPVEFEDLHARLADGNFQLARVDWTMDVMSMDNVLFPLFHSSCVGGSNYSRFADEQVDELIDEARSEQRAAERTSLLQQAEDIVARDCPVIPYLFGARAHVGTRAIECLPFDSFGYAHLDEAELV